MAGHTNPRKGSMTLGLPPPAPRDGVRHTLKLPIPVCILYTWSPSSRKKAGNEKATGETEHFYSRGTEHNQKGLLKQSSQIQL